MPELGALYVLSGLIPSLDVESKSERWGKYKKTPLHVSPYHSTSDPPYLFVSSAEGVFGRTKNQIKSMEQTHKLKKDSTYSSYHSNPF